MVVTVCNTQHGERWKGGGEQQRQRGKRAALFHQANLKPPETLRFNSEGAHKPAFFPFELRGVVLSLSLAVSMPE